MAVKDNGLDVHVVTWRDINRMMLKEEMELATVQYHLCKSKTHVYTQPCYIQFACKEKYVHQTQSKE